MGNHLMSVCSTTQNSWDDQTECYHLADIREEYKGQKGKLMISHRGNSEFMVEAGGYKHIYGPYDVYGDDPGGLCIFDDNIDNLNKFLIRSQKNGKACVVVSMFFIPDGIKEKPSHLGYNIERLMDTGTKT